MSEREATLADILARLRDEGEIDDEGVKRISAHLAARERGRTPLIIRALIAAGAWIAAVCFLGFLGCAGIISTTSNASHFILGLVFVIVATALHAFAGRYLFASQFALALSIAGHLLLLWWAASAFSRPYDDSALGAVFLTSLVLAVILYPLYRDPLHRFLSCMLAANTAAAWLVASERPEGLHVLVLVEFVGLCLLFTRRGFSGRGFAEAERPLGYALAVSLLLALVVLIAAPDKIQVAVWPSKIILTAGLIYLYNWAAGGRLGFGYEPLALAVIPTLVLGAVTTPGVLAAIALLVIGRAHGDRILLALGAAFFPVFIVKFYYDLDLNLMTKSFVLMASGAVLLAARFFLARRPWAHGGEEAAGT